MWYRLCLENIDSYGCALCSYLTLRLVVFLLCSVPTRESVFVPHEKRPVWSCASCCGNMTNHQTKISYPCLVKRQLTPGLGGCYFCVISKQKQDSVIIYLKGHVGARDPSPFASFNLFLDTIKQVLLWWSWAFALRIFILPVSTFPRPSHTDKTITLDHTLKQRLTGRCDAQDA